MGIEDYRVLLKATPRKPLFPGERGRAAHGGSAVSKFVSELEARAALEKLGFAAASTEGGGDKPGGIRLTARMRLDESRREEYIVEALMRSRDQKRGGSVLESLSVRFAVCQPEGAGWHFLKLVKRLCDTLSLVVVQGDKTYSSEAFWAFRLRANEQIRGQEKVWSEIFEHDGERIALAVDDTWRHFLAKHPALISDIEMTMRPPCASPPVPAEADMEATLPPRVARSVAVPRAEKA